MIPHHSFTPPQGLDGPALHIVEMPFKRGAIIMLLVIFALFSHNSFFVSAFMNQFPDKIVQSLFLSSRTLKQELGTEKPSYYTCDPFLKSVHFLKNGSFPLYVGNLT